MTTDQVNEIVDFYFDSLEKQSEYIVETARVMALNDVYTKYGSDGKQVIIDFINNQPTQDEDKCKDCTEKAKLIQYRFDQCNKINQIIYELDESKLKDYIIPMESELYILLMKEAAKVNPTNSSAGIAFILYKYFTQTKEEGIQNA